MLNEPGIASNVLSQLGCKKIIFLYIQHITYIRKLCLRHTVVLYQEHPQSESLKAMICTSQESFCPLAQPAQRKLLRITLECPAVWNISWHTLFSITGTCTSCSRFGTPPPGTKIICTVQKEHNSCILSLSMDQPSWKSEHLSCFYLTYCHQNYQCDGCANC